MLSRSQLLTAWDDPDAASNVVDVAIVRRKTSRSFVETVYGLGYRLKTDISPHAGAPGE